METVSQNYKVLKIESHPQWQQGKTKISKQKHVFTEVPQDRKGRKHYHLYKDLA